MNLLIAEVRAGKREGSVISAQSFDTTARNDQETWEALRRELKDIGIFPDVITEKRHFIIAWFQEAVVAGRLEEDLASDDNNSANVKHGSKNPTGASDDDSIPSREISSMSLEPSTTQRREAPQSGPSASRPLRQPADRSSSPPLQKKGKSRLSVAYLLQKLFRDDQFLQAAGEGNVAKMKKLLEKGFDIEARGLRNSYKNTALHLAIKNGNETTMQFLLSLGADVHAKNAINGTALHFAAHSGKKRIVDLLLEQGADIESKTFRGSTALMLAAWGGHQDTVRLLLEQGADIESEDIFGTALRYAVMQENQDTIQLLLFKGADIESKGSDGRTSLIYAAKKGYQDTVQLLLENGAQVNTKDANGSTAHKWAKRNHHKRIAEMLQNAGAQD